MFKLTSIKLFQFKNYVKRDFDFHKPVILIVGPNGVGKTNLLDAVYYLSFTKSYFMGTEKTNVLHGENAFRIEGKFQIQGSDKEEKAACVYRDGKKEFYLNDKPYNRFSEHIGKFPVVFIAPDDDVIIMGGSAKRRDFLDMLLSQLQPDYLKNLIAYQKVKNQRNSFLKKMEGDLKKTALLETYDSQLETYGTMLYETRKDFLPAFNKEVQKYYEALSLGKEEISIGYESDLEKAPLTQLLKDNRRRDVLLGYTTKGVHRDDLSFLMNGESIKIEGSQGQKKSFLLALKLAQSDFIKEQKKTAPILLLDDIFDKLDTGRMEQLISLILQENFGQVLLTNTEADRIEPLFLDKKIDFQTIGL